MLGLALMAAELAEKRAGYGPFEARYDNVGAWMEKRSDLRMWESHEVTFSREYYAICDRIARGEKP